MAISPANKDFQQILFTYFKHIKKQIMKTLKTIIYTTIILTGITFFTSCEKEQTDTTVPVFTVLEPLAGDTVTGEAHIEFTVTDNIGLKELVVKITNSTGTSVYTQNSNVKDLKVFSFHDHYDLAVYSSITPLTVIISAMDKSGNTKTNEIPIIVKP